MSQPSASRSELWQRHWQRIRTRARSAAPFVSGVAATLVALLLFSRLLPAPHQMTAREVQDTIAKTLASVTPQPPFSAGVYQAIQPSFVLVPTPRPASDNKTDDGLR